MKRSIALIFRLLISILIFWQVLVEINYDIKSITASFVNITNVVNIVSAICFLVLFFYGVFKRPPKNLLMIKSIVTISMLMVFAINTNQIFNVSSSIWFLGVLSPLMVICDYLLFERKGLFNFWGTFFRFGGALLIIALISIPQVLFLGSNDLFLSLGFNGGLHEFLNVLLLLLFASFIMFLIDEVAKILKNNSSKSTFACVVRILYIALGLFCIVFSSGLDFYKILSELKYFQIIICLISVLYYFINTIYNSIKFKSFSNNYSILLIFKGGLITCNIIILIAFFLYGSFKIPFYELCLSMILPIIMIIDYILFDNKGYFNGFDPLIWALLPFAYLCILPFFESNLRNIYPYIFKYSEIVLIIGGYFISAIIGYLFYVMDLVLCTPKNYSK